MFKHLCLLALLALATAGMAQLREQIHNTEQLIFLYQQKLRILRAIYDKNYPNIPSPPLSTPRERKNYTQANKPSSQLALVEKFEHPSLLFQDRYLLSMNEVIDVDTRQTIAEFMGDVLIVEEASVTTLVGGKVNMVAFKQEGGKMKSEEYFLGLNGDPFPSIWHRNYNIKDGEDLLIQWHQNKIYFRGKEVNIMAMPAQQKIISIYSLNQYKVIFVSSLRLGLINSRSLQIGQSQHVTNITKSKLKGSDEVRIVQSYKQDNFIVVLLSTGELAKYYNQKIVTVQLLSSLSEQYNLLHHPLQLQYVHPYLFIANDHLSAVKIYHNQLNRFQEVLHVNTDTTNPLFSFYRQHDSYRAVVSSGNQTRIYEIMLPVVEEAVIPTNYFKFIGIFFVVACFIYFKWFKKADEVTETIQSRRELGSKYRQMERPPRGQPEQNKQKNRLTQHQNYTRSHTNLHNSSLIDPRESEIEQFLKKQAREHKKTI